MAVEYQIKELQERLKELTGSLATFMQRVNDMERQDVRFDSHFTSELGNYSRRIDEIVRDLHTLTVEVNKKSDKQEDRVRILELWKSNLEGQIIVLKVLISILTAVTTGLLLDVLINR